uniref:Uncharacterized protein n=1 Tax=Avena sativa TaxID=4498 RepID=A0ACD5ZA67_AVESA
MPPVVRPRNTSAIALPDPAAGGAPLPEPGRTVPLSPFDVYWVTLPPVRRVFLFPPSQLPFTDVVGALRSSLERVLPSFHPFAGVLTYSPDSHAALSIVLPEGEEGATSSVAFLEAETDLHIDRLVEEYDEDALRQLAPDIRRDELPAPVMAVQVTEFVGAGGALQPFERNVAKGRKIHGPTPLSPPRRNYEITPRTPSASRGHGPRELQDRRSIRKGRGLHFIGRSRNDPIHSECGKKARRKSGLEFLAPLS